MKISTWNVERLRHKEGTGQEEEVGNAVKKSVVPREEFFLTSKVWLEHYGYDAYRALEDLYEEGKLKAIGISNYYVDRMVEFTNFNRIHPMINQVDVHPHNQQIVAKEWMDKYNVQIEAWVPFGEGRSGLFENEVLKEIGEKR